MSSSDESISGLEKLIGFIYRILFTIIPSGAFLFIAFLFAIYCFPLELKSKCYNYFHKLPLFWQALMPLCAVFSLSLFIEGLDRMLFYYMMDFGKLSTLRLFGRKLYSRESKEKVTEEDEKKFIKDIRDSKEMYLNKLYGFADKEKVDSTNEIEYDKRFITQSESHFSLSLIKGLMHHPRVFNYIYYQLGREFAFNNLTVVFLLSTTLFFPYACYKYANISSICIFYLGQFLQPIISAVFLWQSFKALKKYNIYKCSTPKKKDNLILWASIIISLVVAIGAFFMSLGFVNGNAYVLYFAYNILSFPAIISMVFQGFKEYYTVEKYYLVYFIEKQNQKE